MSSVLDRLADHDAAVAKYAREQFAAKQQHEATRRELAAAEKALAAYHHSGIEDEAEESRLVGIVNKIRARTTDDGSRMGLRDVAAAGMAERARRKKNDAEHDRDAFVRENVNEIYAALLAESETVKAAAHDALKVLERVDADWRRVSAHWSALGEPGGIERPDLPRESVVADALTVLRLKLKNSADAPAPRRLQQARELSVAQ